MVYEIWKTQYQFADAKIDSLTLEKCYTESFYG